MTLGSMKALSCRRLLLGIVVGFGSVLAACSPPRESTRGNAIGMPAC
jgi:hypothetical protein